MELSLEEEVELYKVESLKELNFNLKIQIKKEQEAKKEQEELKGLINFLMTGEKSYELETRLAREELSNHIIKSHLDQMQHPEQQALKDILFIKKIKGKSNDRH